MSELTMNVWVYGEYTQGSIGDHLILHGLADALFRHAPDSSVCILSRDNRAVRKTADFVRRASGQAADSIRIVPLRHGKAMLKLRGLTVALRSYGLAHRSDFPHSVFALGHARHRLTAQPPDMLILGGGQMLMDLYPGGILEPLEVVRLCHSHSIPVHGFGIGAGPLESQISLDDAHELLEATGYMGVRDIRSRDLLAKSNPTARIENVGDAAFLLSLRPFPETVRATESSAPVIGLSALPYHRPPYWPNSRKGVFDGYINSWVDAISRLKARWPGVRLLGIPTNIPHDTHCLQDLAGRMGDASAIAVAPVSGIVDVLEAIDRVDLVLGSRMHACIAGMVSGKPAIGIAYQPKVTSLFADLGLEGHCLPVHTNGVFPTGNLVDLVEDCLYCGHTHQAYREAIARRHRLTQQAFDAMLHHAQHSTDN